MLVGEDIILPRSYRSPPHVRLSPIQENYINPVGTDVLGGPMALRSQNAHPSSPKQIYGDALKIIKIFLSYCIEGFFMV